MASLPNLPRYDELRARGEGELLGRFLTLASSTMDKLDEVLRLADGPNSAFAQKLLDNCAARARLMKKRLSEDIAWPMLTPEGGSLGEWGPNKRGPQVDDLLKSARWTAERSDEHLSGRDEPLSLAPVQVTYGMGGRIAA